MASTYSTSLKLQLMGTGDNAGTWGDITNVNLGTALEEAISGSANVVFASGDVVLTLDDDNSTQVARHLRLNLTGTTGGARALVVPAVEKLYMVNNGCGDAVTIKVSGQTGVSVPAGKTLFVYNTGTDCVDAVTHLSSLTLATALPVASGGTGSATAAFSGENITSINADAIATGTIANARTTASSANGASTIVARDASGNFAGNVITGVNLTSGNVSIVGDEIVSTAANADVVINPNGTGAVDVSGAKVVGLGSPTLDTDAVTKLYVDNLAIAGVNYHDPVRGEVEASEGNLNVTYDNGTSGVGATLTSNVNEAFNYGGISDWNVNDRVLIYNQTNAIQNGIYTVTTVGDGSTPWVLTRATDADSYGVSREALSYGTTVFVEEGFGSGELYLCNAEGTITFGTTEITFVIISSASIYSANTATGINLTGTQFFLDVVPVANGGTGSNTATFSGANITNLNANAIATGTVPTARLASGTANNSTYLRGDSTWAALAAPNNGTLTMATSGVGISGSASFTADQAGGSTFTVTSNASSANGASTVVARDANGDFSSRYINASRFQLDSNDYITWSGNAYMSVFVNGGERVRVESDGDLHADGDVIAYSTTISDRRLKDDITNIANALDKVGKINGVTFVRKHNGQASAGVVAQEIMDVLPEAVKEKTLPLQTGSDEDMYYVVEYDAVTGLLVEAVKELKARVEALEGK